MKIVYFALKQLIAVVLVVLLIACGPEKKQASSDLPIVSQESSLAGEAQSSMEKSHVSFKVTGMAKTASGATWLAWPDKVDESLEGIHSSVSTTWNYDSELVSIAYDPKSVTLSKLKMAIEDLGYGAEAHKSNVGADKVALTKVKFPKNIPADLLQAIERAKPTGRLIVVDFWATWCAPCIRFKKVTLVDEDVKKLLGEVEFVFVDLDDYPALGKAWQVTTVPRIFFLTAKGAVIDVLKKYEDPEPFKERLEAALKVNALTK